MPAVFQNLEVDHYIASSLVKGMDLNPKQKQVPIVRIFGVNAKGALSAVPTPVWHLCIV